VTVLSDDERMLLTALAGLPERFGLYDALGVALPPKPSGLRMGGRKRWNAQWEATMKRWDALKRADMVRIVGYDADHRGNLYVITDAGRVALDGARKETA
jgi:hypothetical protein